MSTMSDTKRNRTRRSFTEEFKAGAVRLVFDEGKTVGTAARASGGARWTTLRRQRALSGDAIADNGLERVAISA